MPLVARWIREHAAEAIGADTFLVLQEHSGGYRTTYGHVVDECAPNETVVAELQPVKQVILKAPGLVGRIQNCTPERLIPLAYQLAYAEECLRMVAGHEGDRGREYEQLVVMRPDLLLPAAFTPLTFSTPVHSAFHPDFFFGGPRAVVWRLIIEELANPNSRKYVQPCATSGSVLSLEAYRLPESSDYYVGQGVVRGIGPTGLVDLYTREGWTLPCVSPSERAMLACAGLPARKTVRKGLSDRTVEVCAAPAAAPQRHEGGEALRPPSERAASLAAACEEACWEDANCSAWSAQGPAGCLKSPSPVRPPCECEAEDSRPVAPLVGYKFEDFIPDTMLVDEKLQGYWPITNGDFGKCASYCFLSETCTAWTFRNDTLMCLTFYFTPLRRERRNGFISGYVHWKFPGGRPRRPP